MLNTALNINDEGIFSPSAYPQVVEELRVLKEQASIFPSTYKWEIIVSYLKDHCLKNVWIDANPSLTKLMTSRRLATNGLEAFLEVAKKQPVLLHSFEKYLQTFL